MTTDPTALDQPLTILYLLGDVVNEFNSTDVEDSTLTAEVGNAADIMSCKIHFFSIQ